MGRRSLARRAMSGRLPFRSWWWPGRPWRGPRGRLRTRRAAFLLLAQVDVDACCRMCSSGADQLRKACVSLGLAIAVRRSTRHQWGLPGDVRKRAHRVGNGCSLRSQCSKSAKILPREGIRDAVRHTFDIRGRYVEILQSTHQEQTAQQGHDVWAAARPLVERRDNCLVVC